MDTVTKLYLKKTEGRYSVMLKENVINEFNDFLFFVEWKFVQKTPCYVWATCNVASLSVLTVSKTAEEFTVLQQILIQDSHKQRYLIFARADIVTTIWHPFSTEQIMSQNGISSLKAAWKGLFSRIQEIAQATHYLQLWHLNHISRPLGHCVIELENGSQKEAEINISWHDKPQVQHKSPFYKCWKQTSAQKRTSLSI